MSVRGSQAELAKWFQEPRKLGLDMLFLHPDLHKINGGRCWNGETGSETGSI